MNTRKLGNIPLKDFRLFLEKAGSHPQAVMRNGLKPGSYVL